MLIKCSIFVMKRGLGSVGSYNLQSEHSLLVMVAGHAGIRVI